VSLVNSGNPKFEYRNPKQYQMAKKEKLGLSEPEKNRKSQVDSNGPKKHFKPYDLEERTFEFAKRCRAFVKKLRKSTANVEDGRQLIKASGSVGANYIEANEALSKKDFVMRVKISRKEAKESRYWLSLIDLSGEHELEEERSNLAIEATELMNIFGAILRKA
jgi:four helix bundle protein